MKWVFCFIKFTSSRNGIVYMTDGPLFTIFLAFAALVSVAMWLDYFRRIDVFEKEKTLPLLLALIVGGCTPFLSIQIYKIIEEIGFEENGRFFNDLFYAVFAIGLNEEVCKIIGVVTVFQILKQQINEPIDYLIYAGVTALGFSLVENFNYFSNHGVNIITSRTFYSALEHIINTSIIVYGFYRYQLFQKGKPFLNATVGFILAVASHGLFDFFLRDSVSGYFTAFLSMIIYLVGINFWVQMLNNANNYSTFFDYDKIPVSSKIVYRLFAWYLLTLLIAFVNNALIADLKFSFIALISGLLSDGFLFLIVILRISRFKILKANYLRVKLAFPFYVTKNQDEDFKIPFLNLPVKIRGENYREHLLTRFLNRSVFLFPVSHFSELLNEARTALVKHKYLLFEDVVVYAIELDTGPAPNNYQYILKPKMGAFTQVEDAQPIHGLYKVQLPEGKHFSEIHYNELVFIEWVVVTAIHA